MTRRYRLATLVLAASTLSLVGCAGQKVRGRARGIEQVIKTARQNGAYVCAPKELALAEAHLRRTVDELDHGHLIPAQDHVEVADKNAQLALKNSPPERCAKKKVIDSDGDGCPDTSDPCPHQAEDVDGFQDHDCCPDPDNDGDGIPDREDQCPNEPEDRDGFQDDDGCPDPDNDGDGIPDKDDRCPNEPEDWDGYKDDDGCPDPDNDGDGVLDLVDKCPNEAGPADNDGCPKQAYKLVKVTGDKIELKQQVFFATAKTRILPRSFGLLNEVAKVLVDRPTIEVRIEGHTDIRGGLSYNVRLSQGRADSVRAYLVKRGISSDRMVSVGYGPKRPIADNRTRSGRALNRRVEFVITKQ